MKVTTADGNVVEGSLWEFQEMGFRVIQPSKVKRIKLVRQFADSSDVYNKGFDYTYRVWFTDNKELDICFYSTCDKVQAEEYLRGLFV